MNTKPDLVRNEERPEWKALDAKLEFTEKPCPVCKSERGTPKHERVIAGYNMKFWICQDCNALYARNPLTDESATNIFNSKDFFASDNPGGDNIDYFDFIGGEKYLRKTARGRIGRIKKFKPSGKMLEVASAAGFFLIEAKEAGYDIEGIEISKPMAEWASKKWGVPVRGESVERVDLPAETYDVIATWGVMTILQDPVAAIQKYHRALKPGGVWAFNTYYHDGLWHKMFGARWIALAVQARQVFSNQLVLDIGRREGFELLSHRRDWPHTDLLKIADQLAWNTGFGWLVSAVEKTGMKDVIIKVPLPDVYEYIWRKPE